MSDDTEFSRAREFLRQHQAVSSTQVVEWPCGHAVFHEGFPLVYDLNFLRVEQDCGFDATRLEEAAETLMSTRSLGHRQVVVDQPHVGAGLADGFDELGWKVDRHIVMVHRRPADRPTDTDEVEILDEPRVWPARDRFLRTYEWCDNDDIAAQMHGAYRTWIRAGAGEDLGIVRDGSAVSFAMLWVHDRAAQIEDVATLQAYRDQGLSRAVVTRAVERAHERGCDFVFLVADESDWPKELYRKLGFDPVGTLYYFLKTNS